MMITSVITLLKAKLVECYEGINVMNEGKEGSGNCCVSQPEDMEVGSYPTRCCKDASHSNTQCYGESIMRKLIYFVCNKILIMSFYRFSFQKRNHG